MKRRNANGERAPEFHDAATMSENVSRPHCQPRFDRGMALAYIYLELF
jgi:hypothetical protein